MKNLVMQRRSSFMARAGYGATLMTGLLLLAIWIVAPLGMVAGATEASLNTLDGTMVNLSFQDTELRSVFTALADLAGVNAIFDPGVSGKVTITLKNVPVSEAISTVARVADVTATITNGLLVVSPGRAGTTAAADSEAMLIRVYPLQHVEPSKVVEIVGTVLPTLKVAGHEATRAVVARGTAAELTELESFIKQFDKPGKQVLIEAKVLEVSREGIKKLGLSWTLPAFSSAWNPVTGAMPWSVSKLEAALDALESIGDSKLLARPHITTLSGESASVFVGDRVPVVLKGNADKEDRIEYIEAGITLAISARVNDDGQITTHVKPQVSSIATWTPQGLPQVRSRTAETTVRVQDGQPIVIAGLIREEDRVTMAQLPALGALPLVGSLFRNNNTDSNQMETIVILTPRIIPDTADASTIQGAVEGMDGQLDPTTITAALRTPTPRRPTYTLGVEFIPNVSYNGLVSVALPFYDPLAVELRVLTPINPVRTEHFTYGAGVVATDQLWRLRAGIYGVVNATLASRPPAWKTEIAVALPLIQHNELFVEPHVTMSRPLKSSNATVTTVVGVAFGLRW